MRNTASFFAATPRKRLEQLVIVGSAAMESVAATLELEADQITFNPLADPSLESQQLDQKKRDEMLIDVQDKLNQLVTGAKKTGPVQVFLLDGKGLAAGNATSQATMHALAHSALNNPRQTVAAFLREAQGVDPWTEGESADTAVEVSAESMVKVVADFLHARQVPLATNLEQLQEIIKNCS